MSSESNQNNQTLDYYAQHAELFVNDTAKADMSPILDLFCSRLPAGAHVLDWGCGSGRDAHALSEMAFKVSAVDASPAMCAAAKKLFGIDAECKAFADLKMVEQYDGIWASASLLHVPKADLPELFAKAAWALKPAGVFYASFKLGKYEGMRDGRWFTDLDENELSRLLSPHFAIDQIWITEDVRPERKEHKWLNSLSTKRS